MKTFEYEIKGERQGFSKQQLTKLLRKRHPDAKIEVKEK